MFCTLVNNYSLKILVAMVTADNVVIQMSRQITLQFFNFHFVLFVQRDIVAEWLLPEVPPACMSVTAKKKRLSFIKNQSIPTVNFI